MCFSHKGTHANTGYAASLNNSAALFMVALNAFGFHFIIPSLINYVGREHKNLIRKMIIFGTSIVCLLYLGWLLAIYLLIPQTGTMSLIFITNSPNQVLAFNQVLIHHLNNTSSVQLIQLFQAISMFGSLFCVAISLFDFIKDALSSASNHSAVLLTLLPPLLLTQFSQNMYVMAIVMAGYVAIYLEIVVPFLLMLRPKLAVTRTFSTLHT